MYTDCGPQPTKTSSPVALQPALRSAQRHVCLRRRTGERDAVVEMGQQHLETPHRLPLTRPRSDINACSNSAIASRGPPMTAFDPASSVMRSSSESGSR
jgi:hypothetical protein